MPPYGTSVFGTTSQYCSRLQKVLVLTGKRFQLERATLALDSGALDVLLGKRRAITIPVGAIIKVISGPTQDGMVEVFWEGRRVEMFAVDVDVRGTEIVEHSAQA
jgi:hypothetical protein